MTTTIAEIPTALDTNQAVAVFENGGDRRDIVPPYSTLDFSPFKSPGMRWWSDAQFDILSNPLDPSSVVIKVLNGSREILGSQPVAFDKVYSFTSFGDGTARLDGLKLNVGDTVYLSGPQFEDDSPWDMANAGFWRVVRSSRAQAFVTREGPGSSGVTQEIVVNSPYCIQKVPSVCSGTALIMGPLSGLWPVAYVTAKWFAIKTDMDIQEMHDVSFESIRLSDSYVKDCLVQVDQLSCISVDDTKNPIPLVPKQPGIEAECAYFRLHGFLTSLSVQNMSGVPMKCRIVYRIGT